MFALQLLGQISSLHTTMPYTSLLASCCFNNARFASGLETRSVSSFESRFESALLVDVIEDIGGSAVEAGKDGFVYSISVEFDVDVCLVGVCRSIESRRCWLRPSIPAIQVPFARTVRVYQG